MLTVFGRSYVYGDLRPWGKIVQIPMVHGRLCVNSTPCLLPGFKWFP